MSAESVWDRGYRVFLSHHSANKEEATTLKNALKVYGVSGFLAHEDIRPTQFWQDEIVKALATMQAFVALLTDQFRHSKWTDQEVGYALARGVPIIPIRLGCDPYGFIARIQAISQGWEEVPFEIIKILVSQDEEMLDHYVNAVEQCGSFDNGNKLAKVLDLVESLTDEQAGRLVRAFNENTQVNRSYGFRGARSSYEPGLVEHLERLTGRGHFMFGDEIQDLPF